jgi:hypothetical protein
LGEPESRNCFERLLSPFPKSLTLNPVRVARTATSKPGTYTVIFTSTTAGTVSQLQAQIAGVFFTTKAKVKVD